MVWKFEEPAKPVTPPPKSALMFPREIPLSVVEHTPEAAIKNFKKEVFQFLESLGASVAEITLGWDGIERPKNRAIIFITHTEEDRKATGEAAIKISLDRPTTVAFT
jgi:hypothetical protein